MIRLVAAIFGLILGWFGFVSTAEAAIAAPTQSCVQAYEYDGHRMPMQVVDVNSERGPPAAYDYATSQDAVGDQSRSDSVRPGGTTLRAAFAYDPQVSLAQAVSAVTPTAGLGRVASGDLRAESGAGVAANSAPEAVDVGVKSAKRYPTKAVRQQADAAATDSQGVLRCRVCGEELIPRSGTANSREFDHIYPYSRGGGRDARNIWSLCRSCNREKGPLTLWEWLGHGWFG